MGHLSQCHKPVPGLSFGQRAFLLEQSHEFVRSHQKRQNIHRQFNSMIHLRAMSTLTRRLFLISLLGLFLAVLSNAVTSEGKRYFMWLYLYASVLWLFWIVAVFASKNRKEWGYLLVAWWAIDLMIFITVFSLSVDIKSVGQSKGTDVVMLVAYFPVWFPSIFLVHSVPISAALEQFSALVFGKSNVAALWCEASIYAAIQSVIIVGIAHLNLVRRDKKK